MVDTPEPTMRELIAKSSLGGAAWCRKCHHPDLLHDGRHCMGITVGNVEDPLCSCSHFQPMTIDEYLKWKGDGTHG